MQAILLLVAFSFPLIALPLLASGFDAKLPACCKRDGKHKCAMKNMPGSSGLTLQSVSGKCPLYPAGKPSPAAGKTGLAIPFFHTAAPVASLLTAVAQTETRYRISCSRASQKRGPPSLPLS